MSKTPLTVERFLRCHCGGVVLALLTLYCAACASTDAASPPPAAPETAPTAATPPSEPAAAPASSAQSPAESAVAADTSAAADTNGLPSAEELVAAYVDAVGGEKALRQHTSMRATGVFEMPSMGLSGEFEILAAAPDRLVVRVEVPGVGEILQGSDGEVAWSDNPMTGPSILEGDAREEALRQADFYAELAYPKLYTEMETVERTELDGAAVYKVRFVDSSGKEVFQYFAVDSGLLIGTEGEQDTPMGRVYVSSRAGGYKELGGRIMATELHQSTMGMEQTMTIQKVEFDDVDDSAFALPDTIRALLEPQPASP